MDNAQTIYGLLPPAGVRNVNHTKGELEDLIEWIAPLYLSFAPPERSNSPSG
jgi:hypothetical protein